MKSKIDWLGVFKVVDLGLLGLCFLFYYTVSIFEMNPFYLWDFATIYFVVSNLMNPLTFRKSKFRLIRWTFWHLLSQVICLTIIIIIYPIFYCYIPQYYLPFVFIFPAYFIISMMETVMYFLYKKSIDK